MTKNKPTDLGVTRSLGLISRLAYARAQRAGIRVEKLLRRSRLTIDEIRDVSAPIGVQKQIKFVELVAETIGDANLGFHLALDFDLRAIGLLYYVAASAKTFGEALRRAARCSAIVNEAIVFGIRFEKSLHISFKYRDVARYTDRHQIEFWTTSLVRIARHLTNREIKPLRVRLVHHRNDKTGELRKFFGTQIEGDADADVVELSGASSDLPIVNADPYLHRLLLRVCEETLARRTSRGSSLRIRVENSIVELLPHGNAKIETAAAKLHLSPKKLARRLSDEDLTFSKVLRELRSLLAYRYLADKDLSISQIAWLLGYKEVGAFTRAFQVWTGKSPTAARVQLLR